MRLLIFKVNQLGDNVVFLPVVQSLVVANPSWQITIVTSPLAAPLYRETCPRVQVIEFETASFNNAWKQPVRLLTMLRRLRQPRAEVCLVANDQSNVAHLLARLSGAQLCVGAQTRLRLSALLHHRVPLESEASAAMQNWSIAQAMLEKLGAPLLTQDPPPPDLAAFGRESHDSMLIHPGASREYQRWPLANYIQLANKLSETHAVLWMNHGHADETLLNDRIQRATPASLRDLIRLIAGSRFFIGNNSGPLHLASALGIPGVILIGPSALNWDPMWNRARFDLLREPLLPCQPCDAAGRPANICHNSAEPLACLKRWSVDSVHDRVLTHLQAQS